MIESKFIVITGSKSGVGTTTVANYVATEIAKHGKLTLLIEFSTSTGLSVYMQQGLHEAHKSLFNVMNVPENLNDNTIRSGHSNNLRYICMNFKDDNLKMRNYQPYNISQIISEAKKYFQYIILDLPADGREAATATVFSSDFVHKPDHNIIVLSEQALSFKYLNDFNAILELANETTPRKTTFILNKVEESHYHDYIVDYLPSLPLTKPTNIIYLPYIPEITVASNKGSIYETGVTKRSKLFFHQVDLITDIMIKDLESIKSTLTEETLAEKSKGTSKKSLKKNKARNKKIRESEDLLDEFTSDFNNQYDYDETYDCNQSVNEPTDQLYDLDDEPVYDDEIYDSDDQEYNQPSLKKRVKPFKKVKSTGKKKFHK